ncbi:MAG: DUF6029 family protein [Myxococcota bacterium]
MRGAVAFAAACMAALTLLAPSAARADDVTFDFTESLFADWHWTLDDAQLAPDRRHDVIDLRNRLNARMRWNQNTFGLRLDAAVFTAPPSSQYQNDVRPEEMFIGGEHPGGWRWVAGDDYLTVGRGMALSLRKFDEIGFTTSLRGAHLIYTGGPIGFRVGVGLTNVVNVDLVEEKLVPDPLDLVALARVDIPLGKTVGVGAHVVDLERRHSGLRNAITGLLGDDDDDALSGRKYIRSLVGGADVHVNGIADAVDLFAEFDYLVNDETRATLAGDVPAGKDGSALYVSASGTFGATGVLLEGKRYDHYDVRSSPHPDTFDQQSITQTFPYIAPPTLERIDQRVVNNTDVTGVHLRVDHALGDGDFKKPRHSIFASAAFFADAPAQNEWTFHGYMGFERTTPDGMRLQLQMGFRQEEAPREDIIRLRMVHLDLDWFAVITPGVDLQLHWTHEFRDKNIGAPSLQEGYAEGTFYLSVNLPPHWSVTGQFEYLTDDATERPMFPGGFLQYKLDSQSFIRLFVGRSKGGLKCSGGICRVFPNFDGLKLEATLRF